MAVEARQLGLLEEVDLTKLEVHPRNPRTDVGDITELAASIAQIGVLEPIVGIRHNGKIQAVTGSRRLAAAKKAGLKQIPVRIMEMAEADAAAAALIENLQRKDLNPLEEAAGYQSWLELTGKTQVELAKVIGRAPSTIANTLRLLKASKSIQEALRAQRITAAHVRVLLQLKDDSLFARVNLEKAGMRAPGIGSTVTVDELTYRVHELNESWDKQGPPAIARAQAKLAAVQKNLKGYTITWQTEDRFGDELDLVKALGKPPAKVVGEIWQGSAKKHDKACTCRAFELKQDYDGTLDTERVCIDAKGFAAFEKGEGGGSRRYPRQKDPYGRPTSKAGKAAYVAKRVEQHLAVKSGGGYGRRKPAEPVYRKLVAGGWDADNVARLLAYALTVDHCVNVGAEQLALFHRIQKMSAAKARALVLEHAAAEVNGEVLDRKDGGARLAARVEVMRGFGIPVGPKLAEQADEFIRKLAPAKAKKKAKR